jgi:phosphohistidine phosphatase
MDVLGALSPSREARVKMPELLLLRHAKSRWDEPGVEDHERDLTPRGEAAAARMGVLLRERRLVPDLVLCSTARRAVRTWRLAGAGLDPVPPTAERDDLYLAEPDRLLDLARRHGGAARRLLLVGHNPGMHALAVRLAGTGDPALRATLATKFPTAALARLGFAAPSWDAVAPGAGELLGFWRPRDLGQGRN